MGNLLKVISSSSVLGVFDGIGDVINGIIAPILWGLCDIFFLLLELFDSLYKKFSGLEEIVVGKDTVNQDPVLYLINTNVVQEMFFSILSLSIILLVIFTIFAIVKNIYAEKPKPLGEILRSMTKALLMYLLVPVATVVCLLVGNVVLRAIDGATKVGGANSTAGMLFLSAGYNGNKIRAADSREEAIKQLNTWHKNSSSDLRPSGNTQLAAKYISIMEDNGIDVLSNDEIVDSPKLDLDEVASAIDEAFVNGVIASYKGHTTSIYSLFNVMNYYHISKVSLITVWAGGAFMIFAMGKITWGLISRMFKMTVYFAISPALMAMFPIKGDAVLKSWTGEMVKNATMAYCAIGVMNVVLSVLPAFSQVKLFKTDVMGIANSLASLFITIVALTSAEKLISTLSGWFGTGDALAEGKAAQSGAMKPTKAVVGKATGAFVGAVSAAKGAKDLGMGKGKQFGAFLSGAMGGAGLKNPIAKHIQDSKKAGEEKFKEMDTTTLLGKLTGNVDKTKLAEYEAAEERLKKRKQYEAMGGGSGVYSIAADDGSDAQQAEFREYLSKVDNAGDAVYQTDTARIKNSEKNLKKKQGYVAEVEKVAKANKAHLKSREALKEEFDALYGSGVWDSIATDEDREDLVKNALRDGNVGGQSVERLQSLFETYEETDKADKGARKAMARKAATDVNFNAFITTADGQNLYNNAIDKDLSVVGNLVESRVTQLEKQANILEGEKEELEKLKAELNQRYILGEITDPATLKVIEDYKKAHPGK